MKTLDAIKKLNAVKKEDGELLLAEPIDLKELKGAKEQELAEAFMNAIEGIPVEDEEQVPDELADVYNSLADAEKGIEAEVEKVPEKKPAAKVTEKKVTATAKVPAKPIEKKPEAKKEVEKVSEKKVDKKSEKPSAKVAEKKSEVKKTDSKNTVNSANKSVDGFGFKQGTVVSEQASLLKIGKTTMFQIKEKTGSTCYDLIKRLQKKGIKIVKNDKGILFIDNAK